MDPIPGRTRADLIRPQQGRDQESWPFRGCSLSFDAYSPFFEAGGGEKFSFEGEKERLEDEREILRKELDRWLLASTRARLASKMSWWRGRIKEERGEGGTSRKPLRVLVSHLQI